MAWGMALPVEHMGEAFEARLLASLSSGVVAVDAGARVVALNAAARRILGIPRGEAEPGLGRDVRQLLAAQPRVARLLVEALERGSPRSRAELTLEGAQASTIGFTLSPVRDAGGRQCGAALLFRDLAPIERSDEQERLRDRLAALGQMAAGLAHEIRNPLAAMEVLAGLLERRLAGRPEEQGLLAELTGEFRAVDRAVEQALEFVRPVAFEPATMDPRRVAEDALAAALARTAFEGEVVRDFDASLPVLEIDPEQVRTLITNLLVNAFEAMSAGQGGARPKLTLGLHLLSVSPPELEIVVADTGPGVPAELREKIFYPFFTTRERGSGVGLALAQKIALSHGGRLELEGEPGRGSRFRVRLPAEASGVPVSMGGGEPTPAGGPT